MTKKSFFILGSTIIAFVCIIVGLTELYQNQPIDWLYRGHVKFPDIALAKVILGGCYLLGTLAIIIMQRHSEKKEIEALMMFFIVLSFFGSISSIAILLGIGS